MIEHCVDTAGIRGRLRVAAAGPYRVTTSDIYEMCDEIDALYAYVDVMVPGGIEAFRDAADETEKDD